MNNARWPAAPYLDPSKTCSTHAERDITFAEAFQGYQRTLDTASEKCSLQKMTVHLIARDRKRESPETVCCVPMSA